MLIKTEDDILLAGITGGREKKKKKDKVKPKTNHDKKTISKCKLLNFCI